MLHTLSIGELGRSLNSGQISSVELTRHFLARHAKDKKTEYLEQAWSGLQSSLAAGSGPREEVESSLTLAVDLAHHPQLSSET